jgi:hypothetical protein
MTDKTPGPVLAEIAAHEQAIHSAHEHLANIRQLANDAEQAVVTLHSAWEAALDEEAQTGKLGIADKIRAKRDATEADAKRDIPPKLDRAEDRVMNTEAALDRFLTKHAFDILHELEAEGREVTDKLLKLDQEHARKTEALRNRYHEILNRTREALTCRQPFRPEDWPEGNDVYRLPPLPSEEAFERYERHVNPPEEVRIDAPQLLPVSIN